MTHPLPLSVIICTWKRPDSLRQLLLNLNEQEALPAETLVIEGHPTARGECSAEECPICALPGGESRRHFFARPSLEHQRTVGAELMAMPVACFLDDDVLLEPDCLARISEVFERDTEGAVGGVSGYMTNAPYMERIPWRWRVRRALGVVPALEGGRYHRSGISIPMEMYPPFAGCRPVDFLVGYCMAYRREVLQEIRFVTDMYLGEDLHYSLRVGRKYRLLHCGDARLQHLCDPAGRANSRRHAFMTVYNRFRIHRDCLPNRRLRDLCLLWYAVALDILMIAGSCLLKGEWRAAIDQTAGRLSAVLAVARRGVDAISLTEAGAASSTSARAQEALGTK
jgi:GT2 family glycosyltransferase